MKKALFFLSSIFFIGFMPSQSVVYAVVDIPPFWSYDTHPNFWAAGSDKYTAKKYSLFSGAPNPGYKFNWVWSGPYGSNQRYVIYQAYPNDTPGDYLEWERWSGDLGSHQATVHTYGGPSEASSKPRYPSYSSCLAKQTGVNWPGLTAGAIFSFSPESHDFQGYCSNHWQSSLDPGGYIAIYLKESYPFGTEGRNNMCNRYVPASESPSANTICKISPSAGVVEQRYLIPDSGNYTHGCEMTVYTWGYSYESAENYRNWFRNGELRWTNWINLGWLTSPKSPDDHGWWGAECSRAWSEKPNWIYTGIYKLTATEYFDEGSGPTPEPPLACPTGFSVSCNASGTNATIDWNDLSGAVRYMIRVNADPVGDWVGPGDFADEPINSIYSFSVEGGRGYTYDVQGIRAGESYPYSGCRAPFDRFVCNTPTPTPKPGDANGDGKVDGLDYIIWLNHYNQATSNGASDGDFNRDGKVDGLDYVIWLNYYGI